MPAAAKPNRFPLVYFRPLKIEKAYRRTKSEYAKLPFMAVRRCNVSFADTEGVCHCAEVWAETMYGAAALAVISFRDNDCQPGLVSTLEVEIRPPVVKHTLTVNKLMQWLKGGVSDPRTAAIKNRLLKIKSYSSTAMFTRFELMPSTLN